MIDNSLTNWKTDSEESIYTVNKHHMICCLLLQQFVACCWLGLPASSSVSTILISPILFFSFLSVIAQANVDSYTFFFLSGTILTLFDSLFLLHSWLRCCVILSKSPYENFIGWPDIIQWTLSTWICLTVREKRQTVVCCQTFGVKLYHKPAVIWCKSMASIV